MREEWEFDRGELNRAMLDRQARKEGNRERRTRPGLAATTPMRALAQPCTPSRTKHQCIHASQATPLPNTSSRCSRVS